MEGNSAGRVIKKGIARNNPQILQSILEVRRVVWGIKLTLDL